MNNAPVIVLDYGMGNIHSILKALRLYLPDVRYSNKKEDIQNAHGLVLPGDGAFPAAMANIEKSENQLKQSILSYVASKRPLLGICIGFQILFSDSEEGALHNTTNSSKRRKGLDLIPGHIQKFSFSDQTRIPHMGWNIVIPQTKEKSDKQEEREYMYFIHSYRATSVPKEFILGECNYGKDCFPAIVQKENILATQFHPEKSGEAGLSFLKRWADSLSRDRYEI